MIAILVTIHCILCVLLIVTILMHSGKDAGLSGAFGVGGSSSSPRLETITSVDVAVLLGLVPASAADAAARDAATESWATPAFLRELADAAARAHVRRGLPLAERAAAQAATVSRPS